MFNWVAEGWDRTRGEEQLFEQDSENNEWAAWAAQLCEVIDPLSATGLGVRIGLIRYRRGHATPGSGRKDHRQLRGRDGLPWTFC